MNQKNKKYIILGALIVVFFVLVITSSQSGNKGENGLPVVLPENGESAAPEVSQTVEPVPADAVVPEEGEENLSEEVAVPISVSPAAPGISAKHRTFNITAENGKFDYSEITVNQSDTVHINFTAADKEYDLTLPDYNMKVIAQKGETKIFVFQAVNPGKFTFFCDSCGGLSSAAKGYIIIVGK